MIDEIPNAATQLEAFGVQCLLHVRAKPDGGQSPFRFVCLCHRRTITYAYGDCNRLVVEILELPVYDPDLVASPWRDGEYNGVACHGVIGKHRTLLVIILQQAVPVHDRNRTR